MHWYGGSIAEAVTLYKQRNAIFVVFVEGDNELSVEMATTINDADVQKRLSDQSNFLAIKLKSGSPNYTHFAQIYQFVPVPSLFFIGRNGTPLEVVCAGVDSSNLATRIDRIIQEHYKESSTVQPSTSMQNVKEQTVNLLHSEAAANISGSGGNAVTQKVDDKISADPENKSDSVATKQPRMVETENSGPAAKVAKTEHHEVTKSGQEYDVVCDGDVCVRKPKAMSDGAGPSQPSQEKESENSSTQPAVSEDPTVGMEEKMARAKELLEARRREKAQKEKELEKQKELERRTTGQGVAELKRWQADQELKQIQDERKREKMENNLARQRILEQIAQDRAEQKARGAQPSPPPPQALHQEHQLPATASGDGRTNARVQLKMPDGSSHSAQFPADGTLADVRQYIVDNLQMSQSSFTLWTAFPRRELSEEGATLRELQLVPSAALLVMPRVPRASPVLAPPAPVNNVIAFFTQLFTTLILAPTQQLYTWIRSFLFPPSARSPTPPSAPGAPGARGPPAPGPPGLRRRGNIHRLPGDRHSDDENNTWNGNSTQQM